MSVIDQRLMKRKSHKANSRFLLGGNAIQVKVLPEEITDSGWFAILDQVPPPKIVEGGSNAELVIGGGWMGLHATMRLAELRSNDSIMLVDAGRIGNNSAGK